MTRTPRSRTKKVAARPSEDAAGVLADSLPPQGALAIEPVALLETEAAVATVDADIVTPVVAIIEVAESTSTGLSAETESVAAAPAETSVSENILLPVRGDRSNMRIEVTEERPMLGQRLRAAREVRCWSADDVAHRLHVPTSVINDIEAERFERLGAPIYLRGYLSKYAALVELPQVVVNRALEGFAEPLLKASTESPRVAASWERYRVAVIGAVITFAVAIPVLTLVAGRGINSPVPQVRSLDESDLGETLTVPPVEQGAPESATVLVPSVVSAEVMASSTPLVSESAPLPVADAGAASQTLVEAPDPAPTADTNSALLASMTGFIPAPAPGSHIVEASFREDSWIEIFDQNGRVIEQNLVRAGETRRYESTGVLSVKVGNVGGVELRADGNLIDLNKHARANVARLRLFEATPTP